MKKNIAITVIIVNYNGEKYISKCLDSVLAQKQLDLQSEIIIADNASVDHSIQIIKRKYPQVKLIINKQNLGFGQALNQAAQLAQGQYLCFLNNDTIVDQYWLKYLYLRIKSNAQIAAVNSKTYLCHSSNDNQKKSVKYIQNAGSIVFKTGHGRDRGAIVSNHQQSYEADNEYYQQAKSVLAFCGVSVMIRKNIFLALNGFNPSFFMYYEDINLSLTLLRMGYLIYYEPKSIVYHYHAISSKEWSSFFIYQTEKNHLQNLIIHFPIREIVKQLLLMKLKVGRSLLSLIKNIFEKQSDKYKRNLDIFINRIKILFYLFLNYPTLIKERLKINRLSKISIGQLYEQLY